MASACPESVRIAISSAHGLVGWISGGVHAICQYLLVTGPAYSDGADWSGLLDRSGASALYGTCYAHCVPHVWITEGYLSNPGYRRSCACMYGGHDEWKTWGGTLSGVFGRSMDEFSRVVQPFDE